jgi:transglutaminase-like putative cysteine protease
MRSLIASVCLAVCSIGLLHSQHFPTNAIPDSLTTGAHAVVRLSEQTLTVSSRSSLKLEVRKVVTILNQEGDPHGVFTAYYSAKQRVMGIRIALYDKNGQPIRKVKADDIKDFAAYNEGTLASDLRVKYWRPISGSYPITIDMEYTVVFDGYLSMPAWTPVASYATGVEQASYTIEGSAAEGLHYTRRDETRQTSSGVIGKEGQTWSLSHFKAVEDEPYSPDSDEVFPFVKVTADEVNYCGYKGSLATWNSFGHWIATLLDDRDELPAATIEKVHQLTDGLASPNEKARVLYDFLQNRMRYVSIAFGIGGVQPFKASDVDKWNYGDCKALTNYYLALLKAAGIDGLYCVTLSDDSHPPLDTSLVAPGYFNHVIAAIPSPTDTTWVECTSNYFPFGYLSEAVAGNYTLIITPCGGTLRRIPANKPEQSNEFNHVVANLEADGSATLQLSQRFTGSQLTTGIAFHTLSRDEQQKELYRELPYKDFTLGSFESSYSKQGEPCVLIKATIRCSHFASKAGDRLLIQGNDRMARQAVPASDANRQLPVTSTYTYADADTLVVNFPEGYFVESLPRNTSDTSLFGSFGLTATANDQQVMLTTFQNRNATTAPAESFDRLRQYLLGITKAGKQKIILRRKQTE